MLPIADDHAHHLRLMTWRAHGLGISALVLTCLAIVRAQSPITFAPSDVRSMFHISKSQNRNQVHYGLRLNAACAPVGEEPVFAYWRELEEGPKRMSELLDREQAPYGVAKGQRISVRNGKPRVEFRLRPFPERALLALPRANPNGCSARVTTNVAGHPAILDSIHVVVGFLWQVTSVTVNAHTSAGAPLREVID